jgi:hypothetical protein
MPCAFRFKPIDLTLLNNPTSSYIGFFLLTALCFYLPCFLSAVFMAEWRAML